MQAVQSQIDTVEAQQTAFIDELTSKWNTLDEVASLESYLIEFWIAVTNNDESTITLMTILMSGYINAVGDQQMNTLWEQAMSAAANNQETIFLQKFADLMDRCNQLFDEARNAVDDVLE